MTVFFFNDTATTEIYTLSLHDALPISAPTPPPRRRFRRRPEPLAPRVHSGLTRGDRKSTRLNSSHANISYAVFCLKKKTNTSSLSTLCSSLRPRPVSLPSPPPPSFHSL